MMPINHAWAITSFPAPGRKLFTVMVRPGAGNGASMTLRMNGCTRAGDISRRFSTSSKICTKRGCCYLSWILLAKTRGRRDWNKFLHTILHTHIGCKYPRKVKRDHDFKRNNYPPEDSYVGQGEQAVPLTDIREFIINQSLSSIWFWGYLQQRSHQRPTQVVQKLPTNAEVCCSPFGG